MANLIQIKRSLNTAVPGALANGEQAYTANGDVLFIGSNGQVVAVGGKRTPGTLTANQAIVPNSVSLVDTIKIGNTIANVVISATGITFANTDGEGNTVTITTPNTTEKGGNYYLKADGTWSTVTAGSAAPAGSDQQIQYNDNSVTGGASGFTYNKTGNLVTIANTLYIGSGTANNTQNTTSIKIQSNSTTYALLTEGTLTLANTVSNTKITVPNTTERAGSYFLKADGTWSLVSASPGGADTQVLFNDGGSASNGTAGFTFNKTTNNATIANTLTVGGTHVINSTVSQVGSNVVITSTQMYVGNSIANSTHSNSGFSSSGNTTTLLALSVNNAGIYWGNNSVTGTATITAANSISNVAITPISLSLGNSTSNVFANGLTFYVTSQLLSNTTGLYHSGLVNATAHNTSGWTGNTTVVAPTANTILLGNSIGRWVMSGNTLDLSGVFTSTANVTTTGNVNGAIGYFTGLVNATSHTTSGWTGNTTVVAPTANTILLGNSIGRWVISGNTLNLTGAMTSTGNVTTTGNVNAAIGYFTGLVNAAHFTTTGNANAAVHYAGANVFANATTMYVGNSIANVTISNTGWTSAGNTTTLAVFVANNQGVTVGNSTSTATVLNYNLQNTTSVSTLTGTQLLIGNSTLTGTTYRVGVQNSSSTANLTPIGLIVGSTVVNTTQITVAGGPTINATTLSITDIIVSGNLDINGTVTTIDTTNMSVTDSIIQLARGNAGAAIDIGLVGNYNDGAGRYAGLFWDQSNTAWELFSNTTVDLSAATTIDPAGANSVRAKLNAYFRAGSGTGLFEANSTGTTITANTTWAVAITANTLSLTTQLGASSGGTGQSTYADGDLLYGSGSALAKLTRGADGKILQSNATTITWADLDGGTF